MIHIVHLWEGDILTEYAVVGLVALPFLFGPRALLAAGAAGFLVLYVVSGLPPLVPFRSQAWLGDQARRWPTPASFTAAIFAAMDMCRWPNCRGSCLCSLSILARTFDLFLLSLTLSMCGSASGAKPGDTGSAPPVAQGRVGPRRVSPPAWRRMERDYSGWPDLGGWDQPIRREAEKSSWRSAARRW